MKKKSFNSALAAKPLSDLSLVKRLVVLPLLRNSGELSLFFLIKKKSRSQNNCVLELLKNSQGLRTLVLLRR